MIRFIAENMVEMTMKMEKTMIQRMSHIFAVFDSVLLKHM